ncbi:MAG: M48 family metalloprotease [Myxococcales bacterium]|jgi:predicted Zn-dependent protease
MRKRLVLIAIACAAGLGCAEILRQAGDSVLVSADELLAPSPGNIKRGIRLGKALYDLRKDLTPEQEHFLGRAVSARILVQHEAGYRDKEAIEKGRLEGITAYVSKVGMLVAAAAIEQAAEPRVPYSGWHFVVLDDPKIAAYAAPAGFVFVTTGAVKAAKTEDELACLLAHEVAHVVHGHGIKAVKDSRTSGAVAELLMKATSTLTPAELEQLAQAFHGAIGDVTKAFSKGYAKDTEFEADLLGAQAAAAAGYDPYAMVEYLRTAHKTPQVKSQGHPEPAARIKRLEKELEAPGVASQERSARFAAAKSLL